MKNDNITILKQFTRKLANCRYRVPVTMLVKYLNEGQFGYSYNKDNNKIVTNEFVFADDISAVIKHIRAIFKEPHIALKQDNVVQNASAATKYDAYSINNTLKDEKLWRVRDGEFKPEYVHAYVQEDNLATYENRFICFLIDTLYNATSEKVGQLCANLKTLNSQMGCTQICNAQAYVDFVNQKEEMPVLASNEDVNVNVIASLIKSKKQLEALKCDQLYIACKKAGNYDGENAKNTNIFANDAHYNYCYNFFMNYFNKEVEIAPESQMYRTFVEVNLFSALCSLGFEASKENESIAVSNSANLKFESLEFGRAPFMATLNQLDGNVVLSVTNVIDGNSAKYLIKISNKEDGEFANYTNVFTVSQEQNDQDTILVAPQNGNAIEVLINLIKSCLVLVEGSQFVHTRYCPVCGSALITPDAGDYACLNCQSLYHIFNYQYKDIIWIKKLPNGNAQLRKAKSDLSNIDTANLQIGDVENPQETGLFNAKDYVSISFSEKISQAKAEIKGYYSELKNYLLSYKKVRSSISWGADSFFLGRSSVAKLAIRGKTLVMFVSLNPNDYADSKYFPKDFSDVKKYKDTPMMVKVKSERGVKFAKELIETALNGVEKIENYQAQNFFSEVDGSLLKLGELENAKSGLFAGEYVSISFSGKISQAKKEVKDYYSQVKNYLLSYKKVRSSISWGADSFFLGRSSVAKLAIRGKTLVMFVSLNPNDYADSKYFPKDFSDVKKYKDTPMMVKVKSERGVKFAKELIEIALNGAEKIDGYEDQKFSFPYKSTKQLIELNLAKKVNNN